MNVEQVMKLAAVIPVIRIDRLEDAVPMARALVAGGLPALEVTLRTPVALRATRYTVQILRDPIAGEDGAVVDETFAGQAPDVRVALDLARDGGFLLTFRPQP